MRITLDNITLPGLRRDPSADIVGRVVIFEPGERILIVAPSGRGKTTLIHDLYGCRRDFGGDILFDGVSIREFGADQWARQRQRHLGIVFQDLRLFPRLTARENILVKADLNAETPPDTVDDMAAQLGLTTALDRPCAELSLGEQQRVAILRALTQSMEWLLLDEPFSHLDADATAAVAHLITRHCDRHGAGILITALGHDGTLDTQRELRL